MKYILQSACITVIELVLCAGAVQPAALTLQPPSSSDSQAHGESPMHTAYPYYITHGLTSCQVFTVHYNYRFFY